MISNGVLSAAEDRATAYVSDKTWARVTRRWRGANCTDLARLARGILSGETQLHAGAGRLAGIVFGIMNRSPLEQNFVAELVANLPLPVLDQKLTATARSLQVTGIIICIMANRDIASCACFVDLAKIEGKEILKRMLMTAAIDWKDLHRYPAARQS